jgi:hypothetical protein
MVAHRSHRILKGIEKHIFAPSHGMCVTVSRVQSPAQTLQTSSDKGFPACINEPPYDDPNRALKAAFQGLDNDGEIDSGVSQDLLANSNWPPGLQQHSMSFGDTDFWGEDTVDLSWL